MLLQIPGRIMLGYISTGVQQSLQMHMGNTLHYIGLLHSTTSSINNNSYKDSNWLQQTPYYSRLPAAGVAVYIMRVI